MQVMMRGTLLPWFGSSCLLWGKVHCKPNVTGSTHCLGPLIVIILVAKLKRVASNQRTKHTVRVQHGGKWNTRNSMHCSVRWGLITSNFAAKQKTFYNRPLMSFRLLFVVIFRWCTAQTTAAHSLFSTLLHNEEAANLFLPLSRFCQAVI